MYPRLGYFCVKSNVTQLCTFFLLCYLFLFLCLFFFLSLICGSTVQSILAGARCSRIVGSCSRMDCNTHCIENGAISSSCYYYNKCTCFFDTTSSTTTISEVPRCSFGYGLCEDDCDSNCFSSRCARKYSFFSKYITGTCAQYVGNDLQYLNDRYCICEYNDEEY